MTLQQILDFVNFVIRKSQAGETMTPEQYNVLLAGFNIQIFHDELNAVEVMAKAQGVTLYTALHTSGALLRFIQQAALLTSSGVVQLPTDYVHWLGLIALYNGAPRDIDVLTEESMNNRRSSMLDSQLGIKPAAVIQGNYLRVFPKDVGSTVNARIEFTYLRMAEDPVYDYCFQEGTGLYVYMPVGSYIDNLNNMYLFGGTAIYRANVVHPSKVAGVIYTSITQELDWDIRFHMRFVQALLQAAAPSLNPELLNQYVKEMPR